VQIQVQVRVQGASRSAGTGKKSIHGTAEVADLKGRLLSVVQLLQAEQLVAEDHHFERTELVRVEGARQEGEEAAGREGDVQPR
jgi:hypothetical protein